MGSISVLGGIALILGIGIRYIIARRKFYRRTPTGLEAFNSYERAVGTTILEKLFKFLGLLLILGGIFLLFLGWYDNRTPTKPSQEQVIP